MLRSADRPTAIFATSDTQALGVIAAAHEAGFNVPDDLSVVGYDDIEAADFVGLTTISQRLIESGGRAPSCCSPRWGPDPIPHASSACRRSWSCVRRPLRRRRGASTVGPRSRSEPVISHYKEETS